MHILSTKEYTCLSKRKTANLNVLDSSKLTAILRMTACNINVIREHPQITIRAWIRVRCCCSVRNTEPVLKLECSKSYKRVARLDSFHLSVATYDFLNKVISNNNSDAFNRILLANINIT